MYLPYIWILQLVMDSDNMSLGNKAHYISAEADKTVSPTFSTLRLMKEPEPNVTRFGKRPEMGLGSRILSASANRSSFLYEVLKDGNLARY